MSKHSCMLGNWAGGGGSCCGSQDCCSLTQHLVLAVPNQQKEHELEQYKIVGKPKGTEIGMIQRRLGANQQEKKLERYREDCGQKNRS